MLMNMLFAGFGGQGILFAGKVAAYAGLYDSREVSWLPSYGPEMRGGTANCSVVISDKPIGSPLVLAPDALMVMNLPSYDKFIGSVKEGGVAVVDSTLVQGEQDTKGLRVFRIPATAMAEKEGISGLANMILLGKLLRETKAASDEALKKAVEKSVPPKKAHLIEANLRALQIGKNY